MTAFDASPRATKRRKIDPQESSNIPLSSRAFGAVKEAVFGRSPLRSSPRSRNGSGSIGQTTPVRLNKKADHKGLEESVDWDVPDSDNDGPGGFIRPSMPTSATRSNSVDQSAANRSATTKYPTRRRRGRDEESRREGDEGDGSIRDGPKTVVTPTNIERKRKSRSASQDHDELGQNITGKEVAVTDEVIRNDVNRLRRASRRERQQSRKAGDGKTSRESATFDRSGEQDGSVAFMNNASGGSNRSNTKDLNHNEPRHSSEELRREPRMQSAAPNETVKLTQTPVTRSGRKRVTKEVTEIDDGTTNGTPATPSTRKRGRPRKQTSTATVVQHGEDDNLGFKEIPSRRGSVGPEPKQTSKGDNDPPTEETSLSTTIQTKSGRIRRRATERELDTPIAANSVPSNDVVDAVSEIDIGDSIEGYVEELRHVLENDTTGSLISLKKQMMDGLTGKRRLSLVNLENEYQKLHQLVEQTVLAGEGNSVLVVGSRGTAKTVLVETVIEELAIDHREAFHVIRLNGFIHTDDKLALREIWRQLGREMEVEVDGMGGRSNYADTLTSLLALLSHSAETSEPGQDHIAKSVVFVVDEFDLFASHPRQTLLYNLFDVAQSRNAPIAVLGLTTKVDVVESLEKRVKSRFSQRYIHLSLPKSYTAFQDICNSALACKFSTISTRLSHENANFQKLHTAWTNYVNALFTNDPIFNAFLLKIYTHTKSVPSFLTACLLPISLLSPTNIPAGLDFATETLFPPDSKLHLLPGLSDLELSLLISAARLDIILDTDMCNFSMAYDEYQQLTSRVKAQSSAAGQTAVGGGARVWGREVATGAWERLAELELILPATGGGGKGDMGRANGRMWKVDVGLEEIGPSVSGMSGVMAKWCREI